MLSRTNLYHTGQIHLTGWQYKEVKDHLLQAKHLPMFQLIGHHLVVMEHTSRCHTKLSYPKHQSQNHEYLQYANIGGFENQSSYLSIFVQLTSFSQFFGCLFQNLTKFLELCLYVEEICSATQKRWLLTSQFSSPE